MKTDLLLEEHWDGDVRFRSTRSFIMRGMTQHHDELEMNLVMRGTAFCMVDKTRYELRRDTISWLFPEQEHTLLDVSPDFELWVLIIKPRVLERCGESEETRVLAERNPAGHFCRRVQGHSAQEIAHTLQALWKLRDGLPQKLERWNSGLLYVLHTAWDIYCNVGADVSRQEVHPAVERALQLLCNEPQDERCDGAWLARQVGLNASRLGQLFHEQTGVSLVDYRNRQRLYRFFQLYRRGWEFSVSDAAAQAGFGSYAQFYRVLREFTGCRPAEIRRMAKQEEFSFDSLLAHANS